MAGTVGPHLPCPFVGSRVVSDNTMLSDVG